jgi:subtilisin family serine protease
MSQIRFFTLLVLVCLFIGKMQPLHAEGIITDKLKQKLELSRADDLIRVNIRLEEQYNNERLEQIIFRDASERRQYVVSELRSFSQESQRELIRLLSVQERNSKVEKIQPFWIVNLVSCYAQREVIEQVVRLRGIAIIDYDEEQQVLDPDFYGELNQDDPESRSALAWHVSHIGAPEVWQMGYTGANIVVAILDSGVNYNHQDLAGRMWTHPDFPNHGFNFIDGNHATMDNFFHGTHVAGIVAGIGTAGNKTGVAPGARIMALKVLSNNGGGTQSGVWAGIQFGVEYGAHILNMSLGWSYNWSPDRSAWRIAMINTMNAGVIAAVAAGNEGSIYNQPNNVRTPGDCPPPWRHPDQSPLGGNSAAVTVGSVMSSDIISGFSSRGPVTWRNIAPYNDYPLTPGMGLISPDLVGPGSDVLSLRHNNNNGYVVLSGTSMATPAVAGVMALMLQKNPGLSVVQISKILEESANKITPTKGNIYGSGRLNAVSALEMTPFLGVQYFSHSINDSQGNNDGNVNPGEIVSITLEMENKASVAYNNVVLNVTSTSPYINILTPQVNLGDFAPEQIISFENIISFKALDNMPGNYQINIELQANSTSNAEEVWLSGFQQSAYGPFLEFLDVDVDDSFYGNNNGKLEPGELVTITLPIINTGQIASSAVTVTATIQSPWVKVLSENVLQTGPVEANQVSRLDLELGLLATTPNGSTFNIGLLVQSGHHSFSWQVQLTIGVPAVYSDGDIPSTLRSNPNTNSLATEPGVLSVTIPEGSTITAVDVVYDMVSQNGGWISDQRSYIKCVSPGGAKENTISAGPAALGEGRFRYQRNDLDIANNVLGNVIDFELHAFRLWGGSGSNPDFAYVPDNSWKVVVKYTPPKYEQAFRVKNNLGEVVEGAAIKVGGETFLTGPNGEVTAMVLRGCHLIDVSALKHTSLHSVFVNLQDGVITEIELQRVYGVKFNLSDPSGNPITQANLTLNGDSVEALEVYGLEEGDYSYLVVADGFARVWGEFQMAGQEDVIINRVMEPAYNVTFNVANNFGVALHQAVITIEEETFDPGVYSFIEKFPGVYTYSVAYPAHQTYENSFVVTDSHINIDVVLNDVTSVPFKETPTLKVYPNPAKERVFVHLQPLVDDFGYLSLINHLGQVVWIHKLSRESISNSTIEVNLNGLPGGLYVVRFNGKNAQYSNKLIIY